MIIKTLTLTDFLCMAMALVLVIGLYYIIKWFDNHNKKYAKENPISTWNYRIGTRIVKTPIKEYREFLIFSAYYSNGILGSYGISEINSFEEIKSIEFLNNKIKEALDKPIIDLDNFPKEFDYKAYIETNDGN